ncbi:putative F-box domain, WD40/YVTN repeat-like-containing domain-containing protein [Medicago truncatula]|uniref:Putative F-box domain, WD40/YVTN repeat-like-containing domain-containing protein n=1 Tax=Medicago truncatula TaxID=3880 RepID=A0A396IUB8_MEDTR|nr:putative F-box domain, WD40/YVTN repeat-like-containing domain-containing protein [Medicago truncatula]
MKKVAESCQLPWDLLDIISRMLDFDDLFEFGSVSKNWREFYKIYWRNFIASQEPLLIQRSSSFKQSFSFISLPHHKVFHSKMINNLFPLAYQGSSSGYLIMTQPDNSFILINPFRRRKMIINNSAFKVVFSCFACRVLLAFSRCSKEFFLVVLCRDSDNLYVYQSRNLGWVTYSTPEKVIDFVVLHNTIYVVTDKANIGILSLNSANINVLQLKSTPDVISTSYSHVRLVSCDGHLLVLNFISKETFSVYKIDLSTMDYIKLETLGDIALFYAPRKKYYAMSNPHMWGYENNYVYVIDLACDKYRVYKGDDNKMPKLVLSEVPSERNLSPGVSHSKQPYLNRCFRHLHYEVDYSLDVII